jgi:predicted DNA-binding ribbon-helix-helix protein
MGKAQSTTSINKHSVIVAGHKTSVSLEDEFWHRLQDIADAQGVTVSKLVQKIELEWRKGNLSSAVRVFVLNYFSSQAPVRARGGAPDGAIGAEGGMSTADAAPSANARSLSGSPESAFRATASAPCAITARPGSR